MLIPFGTPFTSIVSITLFCSLSMILTVSSNIFVHKTFLLSGLVTTPCDPFPVLISAVALFAARSMTVTLLEGASSVPWFAT